MGATAGEASTRAEASYESGASTRFVTEPQIRTLDPRGYISPYEDYRRGWRLPLTYGTY